MGYFDSFVHDASVMAKIVEIYPSHAIALCATRAEFERREIFDERAHIVEILSEESASKRVVIAETDREEESEAGGRVFYYPDFFRSRAEELRFDTRRILDAALRGCAASLFRLWGEFDNTEKMARDAECSRRRLYLLDPGEVALPSFDTSLLIPADRGSWVYRLLSLLLHPDLAAFATYELGFRTGRESIVDALAGNLRARLREQHPWSGLRLMTHRRKIAEPYDSANVGADLRFASETIKGLLGRRSQQQDEPVEWSRLRRVGQNLLITHLLLDCEEERRGAKSAKSIAEGIRAIPEECAIAFVPADQLQLVCRALGGESDPVQMVSERVLLGDTVRLGRRGRRSCGDLLDELFGLSRRIEALKQKHIREVAERLSLT